jgi:hypothetical protein
MPTVEAVYTPTLCDAGVLELTQHVKFWCSCGEAANPYALVHMLLRTVRKL